MFKFFFKKNLWETWDNLFHVVLMNFILIGLFALASFLCTFALTLSDKAYCYNPFFLGAILICCPLIFWVIFAEGDNAARIANFDVPSWKDFFRNFKSTFKDGMLFGLMVGALIDIMMITPTYYYSCYVQSKNLMYIVILGFVLWFFLLTFIALQYFLPIRSLMNNGFLKCLKKCYIITFDNLGFTLGLTFLNIAHLLLTVITLGITPGLTGITITNTNALRLRLYKYDWLEVNPELSNKEKKRVPWNELLARDKEILGPVTFKTFIKPWKNK